MEKGEISKRKILTHCNDTIQQCNIQSDITYNEMNVKRKIPLKTFKSKKTWSYGRLFFISNISRPPFTAINLLLPGRVKIGSFYCRAQFKSKVAFLQRVLIWQEEIAEVKT